MENRTDTNHTGYTKETVIDWELIRSLLEVEHYTKIVIIVLILLLNGIVIVLFYKMRKSARRSTSNIYLFNQALADCTIATPLMMHVLPKYIRAHWRHAYCLFMYTIFVSIGSVLINSLDRFVSLKKPMYHWRMMIGRRVTIAILSVWVISIIPAVATAIVFSVMEDKGWRVLLDSVRDILVILFSLVVILVAIILILLFMSASEIKLSVHEQVKDMQSETLSESSEETTPMKYSKQRRMVKLLYAMVFVYAITTLPLLVTEIVYFTEYPLSPHTFTKLAFLSITTYLMYTLSAIINPLLTIFVKNDFYRVLRRYVWQSADQQLDEIERTMTSTEI